MTRALQAASDTRRQFSALPDSPLGVEFGRDIRAANQVHRHAFLPQCIVKVTTRQLPGADHHVVDFEQLVPAVVTDVQATIIDRAVLHARQHLDAALAQTQAVHPARGFAQALARFGALALQQPDFALQGLRFGANTLDPTARG